ncbi:acyl- N-acyltransferase [Pyrenophora seminiperda CCB06]|uniref:Acyl-N-acyltransferase n=1 Tax=Pyrenophora seminiperda CCB06 TaxID=1302712 RepID=A0A3M7MJT6_9PLEO|nr:acyl- N-acyltransferase [Pyrenophora seminiperda CCB06]
MSPHIAQQIAGASMLFYVARRHDTQEVVSVAQWTGPFGAPDATIEESVEQKEERQEFEDEAYRNSLPDGCNRHLTMEFTAGLRSLRERVLCGQKHFLLENLATHPDHRGQGLAGQLMEQVLTQADKQSVLVYLDTASDNSATRLYKRLGFKEQARHTIRNLSRFVAEAELERSRVGSDHTHVAFVRYPMNKV